MMNTPNILIVEDDEFLAKMYQQKLALFGYRTKVIRDGEQAMVELVGDPEALPYQAILLDLVLPARSGFEILAKLRASKDPTRASLPVLVVSNLAHDDAVHQSLLAGVHDYVIKPGSTPSTVVSILKQLVPNAHV